MPRLLFCGTVVPAIAASNPHVKCGWLDARNQWGIRFNDFGTEVVVPGTAVNLGSGKRFLNAASENGPRGQGSPYKPAGSHLRLFRSSLGGREVKCDFRGFPGADDRPFGPVGENSAGIRSQVILSSIPSRKHKMPGCVGMRGVRVSSVGSLNGHARIRDRFAPSLRPCPRHRQIVREP